jgi:hypothetical protein
MWRDPDADRFWQQVAEPETTRPDLRCFVCGGGGHFSVACPLHPARLRRMRGGACGQGPCSNACRSGDHGDCAPHWCECKCHALPLPTG